MSSWRSFRVAALLGLWLGVTGCSYQKSYLTQATSWEDERLMRFRPSINSATVCARLVATNEYEGPFDELRIWDYQSVVLTSVDASQIMQPNIDRMVYDKSRPVRFEVDLEALVYRSAEGTYLFPIVWGLSLAARPLGDSYGRREPQITMPESTVVGLMAYEYLPKIKDYVLRARSDGVEHGFERRAYATAGAPVQHPGLRDLPTILPFAPPYAGPWRWVGGTAGRAINQGARPGNVPLDRSHRGLVPLRASVLRDSTASDGLRTIEAVVLSESLYFALILPVSAQDSPRPPRIISAHFRDSSSLRSALIGGLTDADGYDLETGRNAWGYRPEGTREDGSVYLGRFGPKGRIGRALAINSKGDRFVGAFDEDVEEGPGALFAANGDRIYGTWRRGVLQGTAVEIKASGRANSVLFDQGQVSGVKLAPPAPMNLGAGWVWLGGPSPEPTAISVDGGDALYDVVLAGNRIVKASLRTNGGLVATGRWGDGELVNGTVLTSSGSVYQGPLSAMQPHGNGNLAFSDGSMLDGEFVNGRPHGLMVEASPSGKMVEVRFFKGQKVMREGGIDQQPMSEALLISEVMKATKDFKEAHAKAEANRWKGFFEALASVGVVATLATAQTALAQARLNTTGLSPLTASQLSAQLTSVARLMPLQADLLAIQQFDFSLRQAGRLIRSRELLSPRLRTNYGGLAAFIDNTPYLTADPLVVSPLALRGLAVEANEAPMRLAWRVAEYRLREQAAAGGPAQKVPSLSAPLLSSARAPGRTYEAANFVASGPTQVSMTALLPTPEKSESSSPPLPALAGPPPIWSPAQKDAPLLLGYTLERVEKPPRLPLGIAKPAGPRPDVFVLRLHLKPTARFAEACQAPACEGLGFLGVSTLADGTKKTWRVFLPRERREAFQHPTIVSLTPVLETEFMQAQWSSSLSMPAWIDSRQPGVENPITPMTTCVDFVRTGQPSRCAGYDDAPAVKAE